MNQQAGDAVAAFSQKFGAPVIAAYKAKGVIPETDDLALGGAGIGRGKSGSKPAPVPLP